MAASYQVITQLLTIRVFFAGSIFIYELRPSCCWAFSSERARDRVCVQNLISACIGTDSFITSTCFCQQELLLWAAVVGNPSNTEECRGVSKPCSQGGQEPTGTADTVGVANWKAGMVSSPRRCTDSIYLYIYWGTSSVRPLKNMSHSTAAGRNYRIGNDWVSPELIHLWV